MKKTFLIIATLALAIIIAVSLFSCTKEAASKTTIQKSSVVNNDKKKPPCENADGTPCHTQ